jgi:1-hydroxycarotenoid 3,4-desaturase
MTPASAPVIVIGAGVAGLVAAIDLAAHGVPTRVIERADGPGGKMRTVRIGSAELDAGPTVFTMRWVFDELFTAAGTTLDANVGLQPVETLARHAWNERERLDLFANIERSAQAIGEFAGAAEARRFVEFCAHAGRVYRTLEKPFIRSPRMSSPLSLIGRVGPRGLADLWHIQPFQSLWRALGRHFHDARLRQLFGRYATYCGCSPMLAPATLMLVAHVELDGVWLVRGGMHRLATALQALARRLGVEFRYGAQVVTVEVGHGRATGVRLASGERIAARAVVANADAAAIAGSRLGAAAARGLRPVPERQRSLSAVTWNLVARTSGFELLRHNVFFSRDYETEFDQILRGGRLPAEPTVYVCAQDRDDAGRGAADGAERMLCLVNAPALGDRCDFDASAIESAGERTFSSLRRCGLAIERGPQATVVTTPADFERLFPGTGGALYGRAAHGWRASFDRPGSRTRLPGFYLAGGSTHPGPGVPMAALSGRLAAACVVDDLRRRGAIR